MPVHVFRAANLQAALEEIRERLGPNASVLRTKQCRDGWMGWLGRSYVEVTASDSALPRDVDRWDNTIEHRSSPGTHTVRGGQPIDARSTSRHTPSPSILASPSIEASAKRWQLEAGNAQFDEYVSQLLSLGVPRPTAERWVHAAGGLMSSVGERFESTWLEQLKLAVAREIRFRSPIELDPGGRRVVALVGPTGVGKTTTIAKLAAGFRIHAKQRVGLLTIDTFRIAAAEQLQAYAQLMDLPMRVVQSESQMEPAIEGLGDVDLVLIDTAGRSPRGDERVEQLAELLRTANPDETHLVISATSTAAVVESALQGFAVAKPTAAILTKLDEAPYTAGVLSAMASAEQGRGVPISYLTNGQNVPDDIAVATADALTDKLMLGSITAFGRAREGAISTFKLPHVDAA